MSGSTLLKALKCRVSSESFAVPLYQPWTDLLPKIRSLGKISIGSPTAAIIISLPLADRPFTKEEIALLRGSC